LRLRSSVRWRSYDWSRAAVFGYSRLRGIPASTAGGAASSDRVISLRRRGGTPGIRGERGAAFRHAEHRYLERARCCDDSRVHSCAMPSQHRGRALCAATTEHDKAEAPNRVASIALSCRSAFARSRMVVARHLRSDEGADHVTGQQHRRGDGLIGARNDVVPWRSAVT